MTAKEKSKIVEKACTAIIKKLIGSKGENRDKIIKKESKKHGVNYELINKIIRDKDVCRYE